MMIFFIWLSCFLLFVAGSKLRELFLADMTCRYYAHNLAHQRWDSEPARLKENRRVYRVCVMKIFQPSSIDLLASIFTDAVEERRKVYGQIQRWYTVIAPQEPILAIFPSGISVPSKPISQITRAHSVVICIGSNGNSLTRGESGSLFEESVLLNYANNEPSVERVAKRRVIFQRNIIPDATAENVTAFYYQRLAKCPSVFLESTLPKKAGTVKLGLDKGITDYGPKALGADFATEFGLLYHLNRSSGLVHSDKTMIEGLRLFLPELVVVATLPYISESASVTFNIVPWAPPFHHIRPHQPQVMYLVKANQASDDFWFPVTIDIDKVTFPDYSRRNFIVCHLAPTKVSVSRKCFTTLAKVTLRNPPNTSDRRLLISHLLRTEYSSDLLDPNTKQRYDSVDWHFDGRSVSDYVASERRKSY